MARPPAGTPTVRRWWPGTTWAESDCQHSLTASSWVFAGPCTYPRRGGRWPGGRGEVIRSAGSQRPRPGRPSAPRTLGMKVQRAFAPPLKEGSNPWASLSPHFQPSKSDGKSWVHVQRWATHKCKTQESHSLSVMALNPGQDHRGWPRL